MIRKRHCKRTFNTNTNTLSLSDLAKQDIWISFEAVWSFCENLLKRVSIQVWILLPIWQCWAAIKLWISHLPFGNIYKTKLSRFFRNMLEAAEQKSIHLQCCRKRMKSTFFYWKSCLLCSESNPRPSFWMLSRQDLTSSTKAMSKAKNARIKNFQLNLNFNLK